MAVTVSTKLAATGQRTLASAKRKASAPPITSPSKMIHTL